MGVQARIARHRLACTGFGAVVAQVGDRWRAASPCEGWDARAVLEHVIGFHEVLVLRPLGVRAHRPGDDPVGRWTATEAAIFTALDSASVAGPLTAVPGADAYDLVALLPALTTDVLVHTWDLARAAGIDVRLDEDLCGRALAAGPPPAGEMFAPPVAVPDDADVQVQMLAVYGRRP